MPFLGGACSPCAVLRALRAGLGRGVHQAFRQDLCGGGTRKGRGTLFCGWEKAGWSLEATGLEVPGGPGRLLRRGQQCPEVLFLLNKRQGHTYCCTPHPGLPCRVCRQTMALPAPRLRHPCVSVVRPWAAA